MRTNKFIKITTAVCVGLLVLGTYSCKDAKKEKVAEPEVVEETRNAEPFFDLSLAQ